MATPHQQEIDQEHHVPVILPFYWSVELHQYIWRATGRPVTAASIRAWIDSAIAESKGWAVERTQALINREITISTWINELRGELNAMHTALAEIAIGGSEQWGAAEANRLRTRLTQQTAYLGRLARDVESGFQALDGTLLNRVGLFFEAGRATFEGMRRALMIDIGMTEEMRILHPARHCADCPDLAGIWAPIGSLPAIGDTPCLCITTPHSRVLTIHGLVAISEIQVGEMVMTHLGRFRPVTATPVRFAIGKQQAFVRGEAWLGCTTDHRWLTPIGWRRIGEIANSQLSVYNWRYAKALSELWLSISGPESLGVLSPLSASMCLSGSQGLSGTGMSSMLDQADGFTSVGRSIVGRSHTGGAKGKGISAAAQMEGLDVGVVLSNQDRRPTAVCDLLGGRDSNLADSLPLPVDMDSGKWPNSARLSYSSQEPGLYGRQNRESRIAVGSRTFTTPRSKKSPRTSDLDMSALWQEFQSVPALSSTNPEILFTGLLPGTTPLYDLTVAEDHSFIIEGLVAHNSNCACTFDYR